MKKSTFYTYFENYISECLKNSSQLILLLVVLQHIVLLQLVLLQLVLLHHWNNVTPSLQRIFSPILQKAGQRDLFFNPWFTLQFIRSM